jgi:peptidyl-prolyl cis-trans isomerase D
MTNRSPKEFLKMQQRELLAARMRDLVRSHVRVSPDEAFDAFERDKSKAIVRFAKLDTDWFTRWATNDTDAAVDKWADENKAQVESAWKAAAPKWKDGCTLVSEIVAPFTPDIAEADKTLLKDKLDRAKSLIDKGRSFGSVARELSEGQTASIGGTLGCVSPESYGEGGDVVAKTAAGLAPGAVSNVFESKRGYHLIRSEGTVSGADLEKAGRRAVARPLALRALGEARAKEFASRLIEAARSGARLDDSIAKLAPEFAVQAPAPASGKKKDEKEEAPPESPALSDSHAPKAEVSAPVNADGEPVPGAYGVPIARMAFDLAKPDDVYGDPIAVPGGFVVLQLKEKTVATREEFAAAKDEITGRLEIAKRADALTRYVAELRKAKQDKIEISDRILEEPKTADQD